MHVQIQMLPTAYAKNTILRWALYNLKIFPFFKGPMPQRIQMQAADFRKMSHKALSILY